MENLTIYCWAGPDRLGGPRRTCKRNPDSAWPTLAPASASATDPGPRETERQAGEEEKTAAQLVAGGSSGEAIGATVFASPVRI